MVQLAALIGSQSPTTSSPSAASRCPLDRQSATTSATRAERGRAEQIVGADRVQRMYASAAADELHFQEFLSANCFGDHVARTGIDVPVRELLTLALLVSLGGCDPQVKGHVAANLNVGNGRPTLIGVITVLLPYIGYPPRLGAACCRRPRCRPDRRGRACPAPPGAPAR